MNLKKLHLVNIYLYILIKFILFAANINTTKQAQHVNANFYINNQLEQSIDQTVFLLTQTELKPTATLSSNLSIFKLIVLNTSKNSSALLLNLNTNSSSTLLSNYLLHVDDSRRQAVTVNVTIFRAPNESSLASRQQIKYTIEYILKLFNDSGYGLIKSDMSVIVVAIVRFLNNQTIRIKKPTSNYFEIKTLSSNYYMIRLASASRHLFKAFSDIELKLETLTGELLTLKFKVVDKAALNIQLAANKLTLNMSRPPAYLTYGEQLVYKVEPLLNEHIFTSDISRYVKQFIRFAITNASIPLDAIRIDELSGEVVVSKHVSSSFWLNLSVHDTNKNLFRPTNLFIQFNLCANYTSQFSYDHLIEITPFKASNASYLIYSKAKAKRDLCQTYLYKASKYESLFYVEPQTGQLWLFKNLLYRILPLDFIHIELISSFNYTICEHLHLSLRFNGANLTDKSSLLLRDKFASYKFYKFRVNENEFNRSIGQFRLPDCAASAKCTLVEFQVNNPRPDLAAKIKLVYSNESTEFDVSVTQPFDYELDKLVDFSVMTIFKSVANGDVFLFKTRILISVMDVNDNQPVFKNPFISNQLITTRIDIEQNRNEFSKLLLTKIEAYDADVATLKYYKIKYSIVEIVKFSNKCELSLELDEFSGDLYAINSIGKYEQQCEFKLTARAYNFLDLSSNSATTIEFRLVIEIVNSIQFVNLIDTTNTNLIRLNSAFYNCKLN